MGITTGIATLGNYAGAATNKARVDVLLGLIPDPDTASSAGAKAGDNASYFDEMSPIAAAQLRVELLAMQTAIVNV